MHFEGKFEGNEKAKFSGQFTAFLNNSLIFIDVNNRNVHAGSITLKGILGD